MAVEGRVSKVAEKNGRATTRCDRCHPSLKRLPHGALQSQSQKCALSCSLLTVSPASVARSGHRFSINATGKHSGISTRFYSFARPSAVEMRDTAQRTPHSFTQITVAVRGSPWQSVAVPPSDTRTSLSHNHILPPHRHSSINRASTRCAVKPA